MCHNLDNSKECSKDSKESFQNDISEYPRLKAYLAANKKIGYGIFF